MNANKTQERRPKGQISVRVVLAAIVISLVIQGAAQAWWVGPLFIFWRGGW